MGKNVDDEETSVGKEQRAVNKYHRVFEPGMLHLFYVLDEARQAVGDDQQQTRRQHHGCSREMMPMQHAEGRLSRNQQYQNHQQLSATAAGLSAGKGQQYQRGFSQAIVHIQLPGEEVAVAKMGKVQGKEIDQPIQEPIDAQYAIGVHLSHFFPAQ